MNIQPYFTNYVNVVQVDAKNLEKSKDSLINKKEELAATLQQVERDLKSGISKHIQDLNWCVTVLDPEKDHIILRNAFLALNNLTNSLNETKGNLTELLQKNPNSEKLNDLISKNIQIISELKEEVLNTALIKTHEKMKQVMDLGINMNFDTDQTVIIDDEEFYELPSESNVSSEQRINVNKADLTLSSVNQPQNKASNLTGRLSDVTRNFIFSPGRFYNPVPKRVSQYTLTKDVDLQSAKDNVIGLMKGEEMKTDMTFFPGEGGAVEDKYGEKLMVPSVFAVDLHRTKQFFFNETCLHDQNNSEQYNRNEVARTLYKTFGKEGGERVMYVCNQSCMPYVIIKHILPLIEEKGNFLTQIPKDHIVAPSQASGFVFRVNFDEDKQSVSIEIKLKMKLHTSVENDFTAFFVVKREINIPLKELTDSDFNQLENPAPNLHVTDGISQLIMNNPPEAEELFQKF
jgi:hypothetical protein